MTSFRPGFWLHRAVLSALFALVVAPAAEAASRIKDIANFEGIRENLLVGYGLVVGLNGTGDSLTNAPFTLQSLRGMLDRDRAERLPQSGKQFVGVSRGV